MADINERLALAASPNDMLPGPDADSALMAAGDAGAVTVPTTANLSTTSDAKKAAVTAASANIKARLATPYEMAAGADTQSGTQNMSEYESDMRYMDPSNLTAKYGNAARNMLLSRAAGNFEYQADASRPTRGFDDQVVDTASSVLTGLGNTVGGIAGWGAGLVNDEAGTSIATGLKNATEWVHEQQSPELQAAKRISEARTNLDLRDTEIQYNKEIARGDDETMASLRRIGREAAVAIDNGTDSVTTLVDGTSTAVGSLLAIGPLSKGLTALGRLLVPESTRRGVGLAAAIDTVSGTKSAARVLAGAAETAPVLAAIGLTEGGGAYSQVAADIMGRDHTQLMEESPTYANLINSGMDPEAAKQELANTTGLRAAAITAPLAAATGTLVSKFEGSPFAAKSMGQVVGNMLKEPIEEGIQGGTSQVAQNYSERLTGANPNKDLSEGVGQQVGEGALYGLGMTAVMQAPVGAKRALEATAPYAKLAVVASAQAAAKKIGGSLQARADALNKANEEASPIADATILKAAQDIQETAPAAAETLKTEIATLPPEQQASASEYVDRLMNVFTFDPAELTADAVESLAGTTSRLEAIQTLAGQVMANDENTAGYMSAGYNLFRLLSMYQDVAYSDKAGLEGLAPDSPAFAILADYDALMASIGNTPKVRKALAFIEQKVSEQPPVIASIESATETDIANAITAAEIAPDKADLDTTVKILQQINQGNISATPRQKAALETSRALLNAALAARKKAEALGEHLTESSQVTHEVLTDDRGGRNSAVSFAKGIMRAYKAGDLDTARDTLAHMGEFVQHMSNKVGALNSHLALANPKADGVPYLALQPDRKWKTNKKGLQTDPTDEGRVKFAQTVAMEATVLADVYNGLVTAFPDLGGVHITATPLDSKLDSPFRAATTEAVQNKEDAPAPAKESNPVTVKSPTSPAENAETYKPTAVIMSTPATNEAAKRNADTAIAAARANKKPKAVTEPVKPKAEPRPKPEYTEKPFKPAEMSNSELATQREAIESLEGQRFTEEASDQLDAIIAEQDARATLMDDKTGLSAAFPELARGTFGQAFKLGKERLTFTFGSEAPVELLAKAFRNQSALTAHIGTLKHELTPAMAREYVEYLNTAHDIADAMQENLTAFLGENNLNNRFMSGEDVNLFIAGKALNITEEVDGEIVYNPELVQMAALAGLQWHLTSGDFTSFMDEKDAAAILGIPVEAVFPSMVDALRAGPSAVEAKRAIAAKIIEYWGVKPNGTEPIGVYTGIAESVAAEVMRAMVETGKITVATAYTTSYGEVFFDEPPQGGKSKEYDYIISTPFDTSSELLKFPNAIEQAVMVTPVDVSFIGSDVKIPVSKKQMRQPLVDNTPQQLDALANEQETPHYIQPRMAGLFFAMGDRVLVDLFGAGELDPDNMNKHHARSAEGLNRGITSAYNRMHQLFGEVSNISAKAGVAVSDMPIYYAYNVSKVGRMHMLGQFNPQTSKLMREIVLPTRDTLDLSDKTGQHYANFMLGVAQALGIKVHRQEHAVSIQQAEARLAGDLADTVQVLRDWQNSFDLDSMSALANEFDPNALATLKAGFKGRVTPAALHAVMEYARLQDTDGKNFETSIYLEADGMTNGVVNAMALFSIGSFTPGWVGNMRRGGWFPGQPGMTANTFYTDKSNSDIYEVTRDNLVARIAELRSKLSINDPVREQMSHLLTMMDMFMDDLDFANDLLELNRSITKNPLMISVYGSGAGGIAAKITGAMIEAIYARMSQVVQSRNAGATTWAEAMFGPQSSSLEDAQAKLAKFTKALNALTDYKLYTNKQGKIIRVLNKEGKASKALDPKELTFSSNDLANIRSNMLEMFVRPMRAAISDVVGPTVEISTGLLRDATQAQSIYLKIAFQSELQKALAKKAEDPNWKKGNFLTESELTAIYKSLAHMSPFIETGTQNFFVAGKESNDLNLTQFGRGLNGSFRSPAAVYGPGNAGVSAIATLNIGAGDGQMMQFASTMPNRPEGTIKIFDGMHMRLSQIQEDSIKINNAVWESWMLNPLQDASNSFNKFLLDADLTVTEEHLPELMKVLFPDVKPGNYSLESHGTAIVDRMKLIGRNMRTASLQVEARHRAMARVVSSLDQMAGAASPYQVEGVELTSLDDAGIAAELTVLYAEEYAKLKDELPVSSVGAAVESLGNKHPSGAVVLNWVGLESLTSAIKLPADQQAILEQITKSLAANEYTVVMGTEQEIAKHHEAMGTTPPASDPLDTVGGYTSFENKTIYLLNPSSETLVHELIHAATFEIIQNHYTGALGDTGRNRMTADAIKRLEVLMEQFLSLDQSMVEESAELRNTYENTKAVIEGYLATGIAEDKAAALNEFMAWVLTNNYLQRLAKRTKVSKLAQIAQAVIGAIKSMFFRNRTAPDVGTDMFSNLMFNTAILMQKPQTTGAKYKNSVLQQSVRYGNSERIALVGKAYSQNIAQYLGQLPAPGVMSATAAVNIAITTSIDVADMFTAHGFNMTAQESDAFGHIVAALATEAHLDSNAMLAAQELYAHTIKSMDDKSFLKDKTSTDPTELAASREKFNTLLGKFGTTKNHVGRTTLMPAFLALATVNDEFREVLSSIGLPKSVKVKGQTLDAYAENLGNSFMDKLSARMAGTTRAKNVQEAIDALNYKVADLVQKRETYLDQVADKAGGIVDRANEYVTQGLDKLSKAVIPVSERIRKNAANKLTRYAAAAVSGLSAALSEEVAKDLGKQTLAWANANNLPKPLFDLVNDLVGRTESNADVYDMIKITKSLVQQARQQFREELPKRIFPKKFSRELTEGEWETLYKFIGKTDLASLLDSFSANEAMGLFTDRAKLAAEISRREGLLQAEDSASFPLVQRKSRQLAHYMRTREPGNNLQRNAVAISGLYGMARPTNFIKKGEDYINLVDELVTLYAISDMSQTEQSDMTSLINGEPEGITFMLAYMREQRKEELSKVSGNAIANAYKGYIPTQSLEGTSLVVADDTEFSTLIGKSYKLIGNYGGSNVDATKPAMGYYFAPTSARASYQQGIMQNARTTAQGVDIVSGFSNIMTAGRITNPIEVKKIRLRIAREKATEPLMPVFSEDGSVIAYERSVAPAMLAKIEKEGNLAEAIGMWRGRQFEESMSQLINRALVKKLHAMYLKDIKDDPSTEDQYVNLFDKDLDPVTKDAVAMFNPDTLAIIQDSFGLEFKVRRDLLNDTIGYRAASIGDAWTGNTRWSPEAQKTARNVATTIFGNEAYRKLVNAEQIWKNVVTDARLLIAVKSVVVPMVNVISNVLQLSARGVPLKDITRGAGKKTAELEFYVKGRLRQIELEAEIRAESDPLKSRKFTTELQSIKDANKMLTIWPLLEAGEFSSVSDAGITRSEIMLSTGRLQSYMENAVNKLPGPIATAGRYALVTRDTALFQALQKSVEYGDFLAKAIYYDDLTKRKGMTSKAALGRITEEFVNYDRLSGRFRGALESLGLLWFYNFKIRSTKIALSMLRNNPVNALLAMSAPMVLSPLNTFGSPGLPIQDSLLSKMVSGSLDYSMGPGQGLSAPNLNPWYNLMN